MKVKVIAVSIELSDKGITVTLIRNVSADKVGGVMEVAPDPDFSGRGNSEGPGTTVEETFAPLQRTRAVELRDMTGAHVGTIFR